MMERIFRLGLLAVYVASNIFITIGALMQLKGFLFDLDGTLANTLPLCIKVYQLTMHHFTGKDYTEAEITAHFGLTEAGIFQRLLPEHWQEALDYYHTTYEQLHNECSEPFPGIDGALQRLQQRGIRLAVVTGKGSHTARFTLQYLGLARYFDRVEAGREDAVDKVTAMQRVMTAWQIQPEDAAYIGDAASDIEQSAKAGVLPLAAEWAETATINALEEIRPAASFHTIASFISWIEENIEAIG
jgi:pyrophosphatase PpaX